MIVDVDQGIRLASGAISHVKVLAHTQLLRVLALP